MRFRADRPLAARLKGQAIGRRPLPWRKSVVRLFAKTGGGALNVLLEVADTAHLTQSEMDAARKEIGRILEGGRVRTTAPVLSVG